MQPNGICSCKFRHSSLSEGGGRIAIAQDKPEDKHAFRVTGRRPQLIKVGSNTFPVIFLSVVLGTNTEVQKFCVTSTEILRNLLTPKQAPQTENFYKRRVGKK